MESISLTRKVLKIKRSFLFVQMIMLLGMFLVFTVLLAKGYIGKVREESRNNINTAVNLTIEYISRGEDVPRELSDPYVFFIIDQKDGSYVLDRKDRSDQSNILWEQYRTKLTYQMQRQKRGWISYPALNTRKHFKSSRLIRYSVVEDRDWIVIFEDVLPSNWELFQDVMNKKNIADIMIVIVLGFILLKFITDRYFQLLMVHIKYSSVVSILDFDHAVSKKIVPSAELQETVKRKPLEVYFDEASNIDENKPIDNIEDNDLEKHIDQAPNIKSKRKRVKKIETEVISEIFQPLPVEEEGVLKKANNDELSYGELDDSADNWKVSVQGIKSPVLKKMLKELRNQKEKD